MNYLLTEKFVKNEIITQHLKIHVTHTKKEEIVVENVEKYFFFISLHIDIERCFHIFSSR